MRKTCLGFTLIELLVSISIIGILFTVGIGRYTEFNRRQILNQAAQELKTNLRLAQSRAFSGEKPIACNTLGGYQVSFSAGPPDSYSLQAKCDGLLVGDTKVFYLPTGVVFNPLPNLPVVFKVLAQGVVNATTITLTYSGVGDESVMVTKTGEIR